MKCANSKCFTLNLKSIQHCYYNTYYYIFYFNFFILTGLFFEFHLFCYDMVIPLYDSVVLV